MFAERFRGRRLAASSPQGRFADGAVRLDGRVLDRVDAHGKHMFLGFDGSEPDGGDWLRVHLGMYGMWRFTGDDFENFGRRAAVPPTAAAAPALLASGDEVAAVPFPPPPIGQVRLRLSTGRELADLSGPTACTLMSEPERDAFVATLGDDPLRTDADPERAFRRIAGSRTAIAVLLMRQDLVAGIGNIYRADLLFRAGVAPHKPGRELSRAQWGALWEDAGVLLREGVRLGRIVTTRPEHRAHRRGAVRRDDAFYVAHRAGLPCRVCGTAIRSEPIAGRTLFWCPNCQTG